MSQTEARWQCLVTLLLKQHKGLWRLRYLVGLLSPSRFVDGLLLHPCATKHASFTTVQGEKNTGA